MARVPLLPAKLKFITITKYSGCNIRVTNYVCYTVACFGITRKFITYHKQSGCKPPPPPPPYTS